MRKLSILAVAALLGSAPAAAQVEGHDEQQMPMMHAQGMQHCTAMMGGPPPHLLLRHREALELSAEQVTRLEALQERARETAMPHMQPAMQAHMAAAELLKGDSPDFEGYEAGVREAADHMVLAHVAMARVAVDARGVLTAEQAGRLEELDARMMRGAQPGMRGAGHGAGHGAMGGMMGCMMMDTGSAEQEGTNR